MSARDKDARAAMLLMLRSDIRGSNASHERTKEGTPDDAKVQELQRGLARHAWLLADAMEAERAKRTEAEAPREPLFTVEHLNGAVAAARREGRDAGLREAVDWLADNGYGGAGMALARYIANHLAPVVTAPDVASLQAEHELPKTHAELGALIMNVLAKAGS